MSYVLPSIPDFKAQFLRSFPFAVSPNGGGSGAVVEVTIGAANGGIASVAVTAGGLAYPATVPTAIVQGGKGFGAILALTVVAGVVTGATIVSPGYGYTEVPTVYVSNGTGDNTDVKKVTDYDIAAAIDKAVGFNLSSCLWGSQNAFTRAYSLLAAHYLCEDMLAAASGLGGQATWLTESKTVGNVTESYKIPDRVINSPYLSKLSKTTYGAQFLELVSPQLIANFQSFHRASLP